MNRNRKILLAVFAVALILRFFLCLVNREANDDHMEAISLIADRKAIPESWECAECFQPKLYYVVSAGLLIILDVHEPEARIVVVQLLNFVFSFLLLLFIWKFINSKPFSENIKLTAFALAALNPSLAGINVQVTNDTLIILLGVLTIYFADRYFRNTSRKDGLLLILFTVLSPVVKGSGIVIVVAVVMLFAGHLLFSHKETRKKLLKLLLLLIISVIVVVPVAGGYFYSYINYGTPFSTGIGPTANLETKEPFRWRPGIQSVTGGYLTFRLGGLLKQPYITNDPDTFPLHRTSVWSQLYGRTFFMHFDQHPPSWKNTTPQILNAGRAAFVLGPIPAILFVTGMFLSLMDFVKIHRFNIKSFIMKAEWHHLVFIFGFLGFIVLYTRDYPDFSTMKSVFLLPALPSFLFAFSKGLEYISVPPLRKVILILLAMLMTIHIYDISFLAWQLS